MMMIMMMAMMMINVVSNENDDKSISFTTKKCFSGFCLSSEMLRSDACECKQRHFPSFAYASRDVPNFSEH